MNQTSFPSAMSGLFSPSAKSIDKDVTQPRTDMSSDDKQTDSSFKRNMDNANEEINATKDHPNRDSSNTSSDNGSVDDSSTSPTQALASASVDDSDNAKTQVNNEQGEMAVELLVQQEAPENMLPATPINPLAIPTPLSNQSSAAVSTHAWHTMDSQRIATQIGGLSLQAGKTAEPQLSALSSSSAIMMDTVSIHSSTQVLASASLASTVTPVVDTQMPVLLNNGILANTTMLNKLLADKMGGLSSFGAIADIDIDSIDMSQVKGNEQSSISTSITPITSPILNKLSSELMPTHPISLNTSFQSAGQWGQAVTDQVMWMSSKGIKEATIQLDPPELGSLQVKVGVNQDQAQVSFTVQHASVREALDQQSMRLREMFAEEGLNLADVDVSDQSQQQEQDENNSDGRHAGQGDVDRDSQDMSVTTIRSGTHHYSLVDAYI